MLGVLGAALRGQYDGITASSAHLGDSVVHALAVETDPNAVRIRGRVGRTPGGQLRAGAEVSVGGVVFVLPGSTALQAAAALHRDIRQATDRAGARRLMLYAHGLRQALDAADRIIAAQIAAKKDAA